MKIYLLDIEEAMTLAWQVHFYDVENVEIICDSFEHFMKTHHVDGVVSPANAFGIMDGGYDAAITEVFGETLQQKVQSYIINNFYGEQPVGTAFTIETDIPGTYLIHVPSMRVPEEIRDEGVVYQCMRVCLMEAKKHHLQSVVIPAFGGLTGQVPYKRVAELMHKAYMQIENPPRNLDWDYAIDTHYR